MGSKLSKKLVSPRLGRSVWVWVGHLELVERYRGVVGVVDCSVVSVKIFFGGVVQGVSFFCQGDARQTKPLNQNTDLSMESLLEDTWVAEILSI